MYMQVITRVLEGCVCGGRVGGGPSGFKIQHNGDQIKSGSCDLPSSAVEGFVENLRNLGGHEGNYTPRKRILKAKSNFTLLFINLFRKFVSDI